MSLASPLSSKQKAILSLLRRGLTASEVADQMDTSPQYVHQTRRTAEAKLLIAITDAAQACNIQIRGVSPTEGILWGYSPALQQDAIITYTERHGIKIWYWFPSPEQITDDAFLSETREYLLDLAEEKGIQITDEQRSLHPAKLANIIFDGLIPEVKR